MRHLFIALFISALIQACSGGGSPQGSPNMNNQDSTGDSAIIPLGAPSPDAPKDSADDNPPEDKAAAVVDDANYLKVRTGTPTIGGDHCPAGTELSEGSNDTKGLVSVPTDAKNFTCTINFSKPYPGGPICAITSQGWVTPPDMTYKINAASKDLIEVTGVTQITPLAGYVFNYICL